MRTKPCIILGVFFAFFLSLGSQSSVQAQQENDDPNWRERRLEKRKKETEELRKELEESKRKLEELEKFQLRSKSQFLEIYDYRPSLMQYLHIYNNGPSPISNSRFLEIYDYGPSPMRRRLTEVKRFHPLVRPEG
jgi:hypothetical protein